MDIVCKKIDFGEDSGLYGLGRCFKYIYLYSQSSFAVLVSQEGGGGIGSLGTPIYEPDRYHHMSCLIAMVFKGLHP